MKPVRIDTVRELDTLVAKHNHILPNTYTRGCTLCQSIEPILDSVSETADVAVVMLNPQTNVSVTERYTIRGVPTLLLFEDDKLVDHLVDGFRGTQAVVDFAGKER